MHPPLPSFVASSFVWPISCLNREKTSDIQNVIHVSMLSLSSFPTFTSFFFASSRPHSNRPLNRRDLCYTILCPPPPPTEKREEEKGRTTFLQLIRTAKSHGFIKTANDFFFLIFNPRPMQIPHFTTSALFCSQPN